MIGGTKDQTYASTFMEILGLSCPPLAIKRVEGNDCIPTDYDGNQKLRYCQALMMAKHGQRVRLDPDNINCPAAASAFGFHPLPKKVAQGDMLYNLGLFGNREAAAKTLSMMPRLEDDRYKALIIAPLEMADFTPDVVVLEGEPDKLMWVVLASIFEEGGRHQFQTGVFQATCIDSTVVPFLTGKVNANLGCYGCRESTDIPEEECLLGLPGAMLDSIVSSLVKMGSRALPTARAKNTCHRVLSRDFGRRTILVLGLIWC